MEIVLFERGWVTLSANFRGRGRRPPTNFSDRKLESLGYHVAFLRDTKFSRFDTIPACDTQTHTHKHRHTMVANTRASLAPRG